MQCRDFREVADSYLSDELLVETNHDVIAHLETCAECRRELAARRELRSALRTSFANAADLQLDEQFAGNLHAGLRTMAVSEAASRPAHRRLLIAIAACLIAVVTLAFFVVSQRQRSQTPTETTMIEGRQSNNSPSESPNALTSPADDSLNVVLNNLSSFAAGDHRDCAIGHRLPQRPIDLEEAGRKYDRAYVNLANVMRSQSRNSGEVFEVVAAHWCVFNGKSFAHIVVRHRGHLASLLVTRLDQADRQSANRAQIDPASHVIACSTTGTYQVSCFSALSHAVFVVSDLEEAENLALARRLAPPVYNHITRAANVT